MNSTPQRHTSPLRAIRKKCLWCCAGQVREVALCQAESCVLHLWRMGKRPEGAKASALRAIRRKCLEDCGAPGSHAEVRDCDILDCPIHAFRLGKSPVAEEAREMSREQSRRYASNLLPSIG